MSEIPYHPAADGPAVRIPYHGRDGSEVAVRYRISPESKNRFRWKRGSKPVPYGLDRLEEAREARYVVLVEGESDAQTLWSHGIPALGIPGASSWKEAWVWHLEGIERIYVVDEGDTGGDAIRGWLADSSIRHRVHLVKLVNAKDPSGLYLHDPDGFEAAWQKATKDADPWTDVERGERRARAKEEYAKAEHLLFDPDILGRVKEAIRANGYAGSLLAPLLAFLALLSRLLERPMNLAYVAPSAAGKNRAVDEGLRLTPPEGYHLQKAGSARTLIYTDADFEHKTVVVCEADSLPEDGPAASAVRAIAEDNYMEYEVVELDPETREWGTRRVRKEGPTGIITTSTKPLGAQFGTRTLEVPVPDDDEQTRKILEAHAEEAAGTRPETPTPEPFHAMQRWLELAGVRRVVVEYARQVVDLIPPKSVSLRRHGRQLFIAIKTVAFLHQLNRTRTNDGAIIATVDDYACARELLAPLFETVVSEGVTDAIRATVEAVRKDETVSVAELGMRLGVSKSAAYDRVKRSIAGGWLTNEEHRRGHAARIKLGCPLPKTTTALPSPEQVREAFEFGRTSGKGYLTPKTQVVEDGPGQGSGASPDSGWGVPPLSPPPPAEEEEFHGVERLRQNPEGGEEKTLGLFPEEAKPVKEDPCTTI